MLYFANFWEMEAKIDTQGWTITKIPNVMSSSQGSDASAVAVLNSFCLSCSLICVLILGGLFHPSSSVVHLF